MNSITNIPRRTAATAAMAAGITAAAFSVIQITDSQSAQTTTVGIEHVSLGGLTATLLLLVPLVLYLGRLAQRRRAAMFAVTGQIALAALTVVSNVRGEDPSFFAAVAVPSNLLMFGGWVAVAIGLRRADLLPKAFAVALPLSWVLLFPGSAIGLGAIAGGYYLALGWMLKHELPRPAIHRTRSNPRRPTTQLPLRWRVTRSLHLQAANVRNACEGPSPRALASTSCRLARNGALERGTAVRV